VRRQREVDRTVPQRQVCDRIIESSEELVSSLFGLRLLGVREEAGTIAERE
jgi:hypothetical protein